MDVSYHREEKLNALTHGLGILMGLLGFILLWDRQPNGSGYSAFSVVVYSCSIILLFTASTLYHSVNLKELKSKLRILDHISIYYLIAGTYTPVALITLINGNGWLIFYLIWALALGGTCLKIFFTGRFEIFSLLLYLIMGWMIVFDLTNLIENTSGRGLFLIFLGGAFYTVGIFFYVVRKIPYNHLIWHIFVLGGAFSHWMYIYLDVIPQH
ncbi:MAG: PAQR family membrane homeostasis protein TrhA [Flavobacteriaceae bacterium]